jgi:hypothetical protein
MARPGRHIVTFICMGALMMACMTPAMADSKTRLNVRQEGDLNMSCDQLWDEAFAMRNIIAETRAKQSDARMQDRGIGAAGAVASFLVGTATGGIGIAAAGLAAREASNQRTEEAEELQEAAQQRRALVAGIFMVKNCEGPVENALSDVTVIETKEEPVIAQTGPTEMEPAAGEVLNVETIDVPAGEVTGPNLETDNTPRAKASEFYNQ